MRRGDTIHGEREGDFHAFTVMYLGGSQFRVLFHDPAGEWSNIMTGVEDLEEAAYVVCEALLCDGENRIRQEGYVYPVEVVL